MKMSDSAIEQLKKFEGCKLRSYQCAAGVWTIGYGHTKGVKASMTITQAQADQYLKEDLTTFEKYVNKFKLNQNQFDALVDFAFNLGIGNLSKSTLLKKVIKNPQDPTIEKEFMKWVNAGGRRLEGLVKRRRWEADWYYGQNF